MLSTRCLKHCFGCFYNFILISIIIVISIVRRWLLKNEKTASVGRKYLDGKIDRNTYGNPYTPHTIRMKMYVKKNSFLRMVLYNGKFLSRVNVKKVIFFNQKCISTSKFKSNWIFKTALCPTNLNCQGPLANNVCTRVFT